MSKFELSKDQFGEVEACDSCGCQVPTTRASIIEVPEPRFRLLCEFCYTTMAGSYTQYPARDQGQFLREEIWKAAAAVANYIRFGSQREEATA
jgi:hypothetical protein